MKYNSISLTNYSSLTEYNFNPPKKPYQTIEITKIEPHISFIFHSPQNLPTVPLKILSLENQNTNWRKTFKIKFDKKFDFIPGDSLGIYCPNSNQLIDTMLNVLKINPEESFEFTLANYHFEGTFYEFFKYHYDFRAIPKKIFLYNLSNTIINPEKKNALLYLLTQHGVNDYINLIKNYNTILDIIIFFECKPTSEMIFTFAQFIKPRYFSLINKRLDNSEILAGIHEVKRNDETYYGQCSEYFLNPLNEIHGFVRPNKLFQCSGENKILMIGTGTGIAPFLSFIQNHPGEMWLIYGCRSKDDNLAKNLKIKSTILLSSENNRVTSFLKNNHEVQDYISNGTSIYVCGNISMMKEVKGILENYKDVEIGKNLFFDSWA